MKVLGLAGRAGSGKDAIADYLEERYGFVKFSFSDALYREVAEAFGLDDDSLLRDRATKDTPQDALSLVHCANDQFVELASGPGRIPEIVQYLSSFNQPLSPRQILQWWGTEYRRSQDPNYWVQRAHDWLLAVRRLAAYPEQRIDRFVNTSVRFPNEQAWIRGFIAGNVWHVTSTHPGLVAVNPHESETPLPVLDGEREIGNNYTLEYLYMAVDQLMGSSIQSIQADPPEDK